MTYIQRGFLCRILASRPTRPNFAGREASVNFVRGARGQFRLQCDLGGGHAQASGTGGALGATDVQATATI
jgi:hypothetical protein